MNFWIDGNHWVMCTIVSFAFGVAIVKLYNETVTRKGKARKTPNGMLVYAEVKQ